MQASPRVLTSPDSAKQRRSSNLMARTTAKKAIIENSDEDSSDFDTSFDIGRAKKSKSKMVNRARKSSTESLTPNRTPLKSLQNRLSGDLRRQSLSNAYRSSASSQDTENNAPTATSTSKLGQRIASGGRIAGLAAVRAVNPLSASLNGSSGGGSSSSVEHDGLGQPTLSKQTMNENYEEWMKMATDNKINASNTWNFALIDYFHDMSLLRNSDADGSINFQKASCTLDGCVKIWTSRVDSTASAVGKLMSGLAEDARNFDNAEGSASEDENEDEINAGKVDARQKKRAAVAKGSTLVEHFDKIRQKNGVDLEFTVDPLFKKTCADFDEGGASGILMNHLGCDRSMRVVFDAGDCKMPAETEEEESTEITEGDVDEGLAVLDVAKLKTLVDDAEDFDNMTICPFLANFKFNSEENIHFELTSSTSTQPVRPEDQDLDAPDFLQDPDLDVFGDQNFDAPAQFHGEEDFFETIEPGMDGDDFSDVGDGHFLETPLGEARQLDPPHRVNERELVIAMSHGDASVLDYFNQSFTRNWAGPQHWRMHRPQTSNLPKDASSRLARASTKEKATIAIDFKSKRTIPVADLMSKASGRQASTTLKITEPKSDHLLPDDMHFSAASLLRLFLKPRVMISTRTRRQNRFQSDDSVDPPLQEVDAQYWAEANANRLLGDEVDDADEDGLPASFGTQFINGDETDFGNLFGDDDLFAPAATPAPEEEEEEEEDDLLAATQGQAAKRARPEYVNFAKRAKRVDVKRLKDNIWKELAVTALATDEQLPDDATQARDFTQVLGGLRKNYPKEKMDEISTSFCFICLLHLANENGLRINTTEQSQETVGDLTDLNIVKEQAD